MDKKSVILLLLKYVKPFILVNLICLIIGLCYHHISVIQRLSDYGLPLRIYFVLLFYSYGWIFAMTFPLSVLVSTMILFARIPIDNLTVSDKNYTLLRLISPLLILSIILIVLFYFHCDKILPEFNHRLVVNHDAIDHFYNSKDSTRHIIINYINYDGHPRTMREMSRSMLIAEINRNRKDIGDRLSEEIVSKAKGENDGYYQRRIVFYEEEISRLRSELYKRYSLSFSVLCFVWLGAPLGFILRKKILFNICGIGFGSFYLWWLSLGIVDKLCQRNYAPPVAMWVPDGLLILAGLIFFYFASKKFILLKEREGSLPANPALELM